MPIPITKPVSRRTRAALNKRGRELLIQLDRLVQTHERLTRQLLASDEHMLSHQAAIVVTADREFTGRLIIRCAYSINKVSRGEVHISA